jgi:hypothetical protein
MDSFPYIIEKFFAKTINLDLQITDVNYIHFLSNQNNHFQRSINHIIDHIFSEGKIELCDIPRIVLEISDIIKKHIRYYDIREVNITNIVKLIMNAILESEIITIGAIEKLHIKQMIDMSLDLIEFNQDKDKEQSNTSWPSWCFLFC